MQFENVKKIFVFGTYFTFTVVAIKEIFLYERILDELYYRFFLSIFVSMNFISYVLFFIIIFFCLPVSLYFNYLGLIGGKITFSCIWGEGKGALHVFVVSCLLVFITFTFNFFASCMAQFAHSPPIWGEKAHVEIGALIKEREIEWGEERNLEKEGNRNIVWNCFEWTELSKLSVSSPMQSMGSFNNMVDRDQLRMDKKFQSDKKKSDREREGEINEKDIFFESVSGRFEPTTPV